MSIHKALVIGAGSGAGDATASTRNGPGKGDKTR